MMLYLICQNWEQLRLEILSSINEVCGEQDTTIEEDKIQQKIEKSISLDGQVLMLDF